MRGHAKHLTKGVAIYGAGDAAVQLVNFFLLAVYVKGGFLGTLDYGAIGLIGGVEMLTKVLSRWGLDGAFMRYYLDRDDGRSRQQLTSTIVWFLVVVNALLFTVGFALSGVLGRSLFDAPDYLTGLRVMLANMFLMSFTFVPFHVMRIRNEAAMFSLFAFVRSVGTLLLRVALVIGAHKGITGWYLADLIMTLSILPFLWRWCRSIVTATFSVSELRTVLRFGLPRLPHGLALQALDGGNKILLGRYIPQSDVGVYQNGTTLGTAIRFFTSAFETAWAPFYYATAKQSDAKDVFRKMTTYGVAVLALLVAGTIAVGRDVVVLMLKPDFFGAARVIPFIAIGMGFQGIYLLTSIGLNLTSRTEFYPAASIAAATVGLGSGVVLMPRYGIVGAAIAFMLSYVTQAVVGSLLSARFYPIAYETGRVIRVVTAATAAALIALWVIPPMPPLAGFLVRGATTVGVYVAALWMSAFFRHTELAFAREMLARLRKPAARPSPSTITNVD